MADSKFFSRGGPFFLSRIVETLGLDLPDGADGAKVLDDVAPLSAAGPAAVSFLFNRHYVAALANTKAGAVLVEAEFSDQVPEGCIALVTRRPYYDFARTAQMFYPEPAVEPGIHPRAVVDHDAMIDERARLDAGVVVEAGAKIAADAWIGANAVIDRDVTIGRGTWVGANAYIGYADIGEHCRLHAGARVGTRGFGFAMDADGYVDIPQVGLVQIGHFVEVGANSTIDRGSGPDTVIGDGTKIDNLVQIAHNVRLGRGCVLAGQVGIAGSTVLEDFVLCGAQAGVSGHLTIRKGAQVAAKGGVIRDIEPGGKVGGLPAVPVRQWLRQHVFVNGLIQGASRKVRRRTKS